MEPKKNGNPFVKKGDCNGGCIATEDERERERVCVCVCV